MFKAIFGVILREKLCSRIYCNRGYDVTNDVILIFGRKVIADRAKFRCVYFSQKSYKTTCDPLALIAILSIE